MAQLEKSLCFVLMPYERSRSGRDITRVDFDRLYYEVIAPAVSDVGLEPLRADQERRGGMFVKTMFERLSFCEFAIADLTLHNPNVFYELGIRHGRRPWTTVLMFQNHVRLPLDVASNAALTYSQAVLDSAENMATTRAMLADRLRTAEEHQVDSPFFQLVTGLPEPELSHGRLDALAKAAVRESTQSQHILDAELAGPDSLRQFIADLGDLRRAAPEDLSVLLMSLRAQEMWSDVLELIKSGPREFADLWVVREQRAAALGRTGEYRRAAELLGAMAQERPSAETYGLLGGVYKRQWRHLREQARSSSATVARRRAHDAYLRGFELDWRDPYPGINAVRLAAIENLNEALEGRIIGALDYALERRLSMPNPEYWDLASALQLFIVRGRTSEADDIVYDLLFQLDQPFEKTATLEDLEELAAVSGAHGNDRWHSDLLTTIRDHEPLRH